ncbi:hypothetical protein ACJIZ3_008330 [Penstemon smallii]|uniref:Uncharacterized protein n=1 Tax=Penstemon smallii TaxID=265156 RepID=A0ABD3T9H8_9LAMI
MCITKGRNVSISSIKYSYIKGRCHLHHNVYREFLHFTVSGGSAIVVVMAPSSTILILLSLIFSFIHLLYYFFFCVFIFGEELEKRSGLVTRKCVFSPSTVSGHVRIIVM